MEKRESMRPNILFYFTDQQRADTLGCYGQKLDVSPNLDRLAKDGVLFEEAYTPQPVCGPCRAMFQTGIYPAKLGCWRNGQPLPEGVKTLADYFDEAGYDTAYIGKWHLAERLEDYNHMNEDYGRRAVPPEKRGGYRGYWRAADVLESTSHGYGGCVFDNEMRKCEFSGYRADCITDFALEYLKHYEQERPFFLTISHIEPHHQNDHHRYEGPEGSRERFADFVLPGDLEALGGDAGEMYPDYLGSCRSLDDNLGRIISVLKEKGMFENTVIVYASDHGSHFRTRNMDDHCLGSDDYKRSCHSACLRVPLVIHGPGFTGGKRVKEIVSTAGLPKTFLAMAGVEVGEQMAGEDLRTVADGTMPDRKNYAYAQISESRTGRCIHTPEYLYAVYAPGQDGWMQGAGSVYADDFLYDLKKDPYELHNLIGNAKYNKVKQELRRLLIEEIVRSGDPRPAIIDRANYW